MLSLTYMFFYKHGRPDFLAKSLACSKHVAGTIFYLKVKYTPCFQSKLREFSRVVGQFQTKFNSSSTAACVFTRGIFRPDPKFNMVTKKHVNRPTLNLPLERPRGCKQIQIFILPPFSEKAIFSKFSNQVSYGNFNM